MPKQKPAIEDVAIHMQNERTSDVKAIAASLLPEVQTVGTEKTSQADLNDIMYRNWNVPGFRDAIYALNPKTFTEKAQAMVAAHGHPPLPLPPVPVMGLPMAPGGPDGGMPPGAPGGMPPEQAAQMASQAMSGAGPMPAGG